MAVAAEGVSLRNRLAAEAVSETPDAVVLSSLRRTADEAESTAVEATVRGHLKFFFSIALEEVTCTLMAGA